MADINNFGPIVKSPGNLKNGDIYNGKVINLAVDKQYRGLIDTFTLLLKSTRFQALLIYTITGVIINLVPQLESARTFINQGLFVVIAFILGKSIEDAVIAWKGSKDTVPTNNDKNIEEMAKVFWDLFNKNLLAVNTEPPTETPPAEDTEV